MTDTQFHTTPSTLEKALRAAMLNASPDNTLPIIASVALTVTDNGTVVAVATDRYTMTRVKIGVNLDHPHDTDGIKAKPAIIPTADVKSLLAWLKPRTKGYQDKAGVDVTVADGTMRLVTGDGDTYTVRLLDGDYPAVQKLVKPWTGPEDGASATAATPAYLERFGKIGKILIQPSRNPLEISLGEGPDKPVAFRGRDGDGDLVFEGLLMTIRNTNLDSTDQL